MMTDQARVTRDFHVIAIAAGLASTGHEGAATYGRHLLERCDLNAVADHADGLTRFLREKKCLAFLPTVRDFLDDARFDEMWAVWTLLNAVTDVRLTTLLPAFAAIRSAGADVMPYKGFDMIYGYPNTAQARFVVDVDPLVRPGDLRTSHEALVGAGFRQGSVDRTRLDETGAGLALEPLDPGDVDWVINNHHETHPYFRFASPDWLADHVDLLRKYTPMAIVDGRPYIEAMVDLHQSIASGFEEEDVWAHPSRTRLPDGHEYPAPAPEVYLCLYLGRAYSVTQVFNDPPLQAIADAARVLASRPVSWDLLDELSEKYRLYAPIYYGLSMLAQVLNDESVLPRAQVNRFQQSLATHREYDLGPFTAKFVQTLHSPSLTDVIGDPRP